MRQPFLRRYLGLSLAALPLAFAIAALRAHQPTPIVTAPTQSTPPATAVPAAAQPAHTPSPQSVPPTNTPTVAVAALPTMAIPTVVSTPTTTAQSTPTPRPAGTAPRVGLHVGHWKSNELPDELARLRTSSGAYAAGYAEADVNLAIAQLVAALLTPRGIVVDLLPATVPPGYDADAFVAIHADGSTSGASRGFKLATPWRTSRAAQHLLEALNAEYAAATGLPQDGGITFNMRGYYAFSYRRHTHAIARTTPAVIIEMGFLTSAQDRALLIGQPDTVAAGIANGIVRYLNERDPNDGAALLPPEFKSQRAISPDGVDVRAAPRDDAPVLVRVGAERSFNPLQERDGWYQVFARSGEQRVIGWVRAELLMETSDPTPTPLPATDS